MAFLRNLTMNLDYYLYNFNTKTVEPVNWADDDHVIQFIEIGVGRGRYRDLREHGMEPKPAFWQVVSEEFERPYQFDRPRLSEGWATLMQPLPAGSFSFGYPIAGTVGIDIPGDSLPQEGITLTGMSINPYYIGPEMFAVIDGHLKLRNPQSQQPH